MVQTKDRYHPS